MKTLLKIALLLFVIFFAMGWTTWLLKKVIGWVIFAALIGLVYRLFCAEKTTAQQ
jgi:hypothetical protein